MADNVNKQVRWFDHQFVRASDFEAEQAFSNDRRLRHNRGFHTPGVVEGLEPSWADAGHSGVNVTPGWAVDANGNEMIVLSPGPGAVAVSGDASIWIQAGRNAADASSDPGTAGEDTRWDESPTVFAAPASPRPAGAVLLATISGGTLADAREMAGLGGRDVILSKDIKEADPGTTQDTNTGAGVKTGHIKDDAITSSKLAQDSVTSRAIGANQVTSDELAHNSGNDALRAVDTDHIKDGAITPAKLKSGVAFPFQPADGSVKTSTIADGAVTLPKLATNLGLDTQRLADGSVTSAKIADGNVTTAELADGNVTTAKIANLGVTTAKIADANVTTAKLADGNVTTAKLADSSVTAAKIADGNVTSAELATDAVTQAKIANASVSLAEMRTGGFGSSSVALAADAFTTFQFAAGEPVFVPGLTVTVAPGAPVALTPRVDLSWFVTGTGTSLRLTNATAGTIGGIIRLPWAVQVSYTMPSIHTS